MGLTPQQILDLLSTPAPDLSTLRERAARAIAVTPAADRIGHGRGDQWKPRVPDVVGLPAQVVGALLDGDGLGLLRFRRSEWGDLHNLVVDGPYESVLRSVVLLDKDRVARKTGETVAALCLRASRDAGMYTAIIAGSETDAKFDQVPDGWVRVFCPDTPGISYGALSGFKAPHGVHRLAVPAGAKPLTVAGETVGWVRGRDIGLRVHPLLGRNGRLSAAGADDREAFLRAVLLAARPLLNGAVIEPTVPPAHLLDWAEASRQAVLCMSVAASGTQADRARAKVDEDRPGTLRSKIESNRRLIERLEKEIGEYELELDSLNGDEGAIARDRVAARALDILTGLDGMVAEAAEIPGVIDATIEMIDDRAHLTVHTASVVHAIGDEHRQNSGEFEIAVPVHLKQNEAHPRVRLRRFDAGETMPNFTTTSTFHGEVEKACKAQDPVAAMRSIVGDISERLPSYITLRRAPMVHADTPLGWQPVEAPSADSQPAGSGAISALAELLA